MMAKATVTPYDERSVEDLRKELGKRDLPVSGSKAELVDRLVEDDEAFAEAPAQEPEAVPAPTARDRTECVAPGPFHVGRAVNGVVCSYHAMHYRPDGTPRA